MIANFVQTIDGVVSIPDVPRSNALIAAESDADRFLMGLLRAFADAILVGSGTMLANLGMSTQLAVFGTTLAVGRPLVYLWVLLAQLLVVVMLFARRETLMRSNREVVLEHR